MSPGGCGGQVVVDGVGRLQDERTGRRVKEEGEVTAVKD